MQGYLFKVKLDNLLFYFTKNEFILPIKKNSHFLNNVFDFFVAAVVKETLIINLRLIIIKH